MLELTVFCTEQLCSDVSVTIIISSPTVRHYSVDLWLVSSAFYFEQEFWSLIIFTLDTTECVVCCSCPWWTDKVVHEEEEGRHSLCDYRRDLWKPRGKCQMAENLKALHSLSAMTHRRFSRLQIPISLDLSLSLALNLSLNPLLNAPLLSFFLKTLRCLLGPLQLLIRITEVCFILLCVFVSCVHAVLPRSSIFGNEKLAIQVGFILVKTVPL